MKKEGTEMKSNFEEGLAVFVQARDRAAANVESLKERITGLESDREAKQRELTDAVKGIIEGNESADTALELKREMAALNTLIDELRSQGVLQADRALREANAALVNGLRSLIVPSQNEVKANVASYLRAIEKAVNDWREYLDKLLPTLGLSGLAYWERENLFQVIIERDRQRFEKLLVP